MKTACETTAVVCLGGGDLIGNLCSWSVSDKVAVVLTFKDNTECVTKKVIGESEGA